MAKYNPGVLLDVNLSHGWTTIYGTTTERFSDADRNKALKLSVSGSMVLCAEDDEIEAFVETIEPATSDGFSSGTCVTHGSNVRWWVFGDNLEIGDYVVCGKQTAPRVANVNRNHPYNQFGTTVVKKGNPVNFKWRVIAKSRRANNVFLIAAI